MKDLLSKVTLPTIFSKSAFASPFTLIQTAWPKMSKLPGGKQLFSQIASRYIPYTGSIHPVVQKIENGTVTVSMKDRRAVRNHLDSIHAIALANLGEFSTGLAVYSQLKGKKKAILVNIGAEYIKKARGELRSEVTFQIPESYESETDFPVTAEIKNKQNEVVTRVSATWRVRF